MEDILDSFLVLQYFQEAVLATRVYQGNRRSIVYFYGSEVVYLKVFWLISLGFMSRRSTVSRLLILVSQYCCLSFFSFHRCYNSSVFSRGYSAKKKRLCLSECSERTILIKDTKTADVALERRPRGSSLNCFFFEDFSVSPSELRAHIAVTPQQWRGVRLWPGQKDFPV